MQVAFHDAVLAAFVAAGTEHFRRAPASMSCCNAHAANWRIRSPPWPTSIAARNPDRQTSSIAIGVLGR